MAWSWSGNTEPWSFFSQSAWENIVKRKSCVHVILWMHSMVFCGESRHCFPIGVTLNAWIFLLLTAYERSLGIRFLATVWTILARSFVRKDNEWHGSKELSDKWLDSLKTKRRSSPDMYFKPSLRNGRWLTIMGLLMPLSFIISHVSQKHGLLLPVNHTHVPSSEVKTLSPLTSTRALLVLWECGSKHALEQCLFTWKRPTAPTSSLVNSTLEDGPLALASFRYGWSNHTYVSWNVQAGMETIELSRACTVIPARECH